MIFSNMRNIVTSIAAALALLSCTVAEPVPAGGGGTAAVRLEIGAGTRSSISAPEDAISSLELYFYLDGVLVPGLTVSMSGCTGNSQTVEVPLGVGREYRVAAFANCSPSEAPQTFDALAGLRYSCDGIGAWGGGLPMAGLKSITVTYPAEPVQIQLTRLAARLNLGIDTSGLEHGGIVFNSVKVRQMNRVCPFFGQGAAAAAPDVCDGDIATAADILNLNASGGGEWVVPFYLLENMQGNLLAGNTDPDLKTPDAVSAAGGDPSLCTYLEIVGVYTDRSGFLKGEPFTTRFYLGRDAVSNFDVARNCRYNICLKMSDKGCLRSDWKIESNLDDRRRLKFTETSVSVEAPAQGTVTLNTNLSYADGDYRYTISGDTAFFDFIPGESGFTIKPRADITARKTVTITAVTWDGAISTSCRVRGNPDPSRLIEIINWDGELYVGQKKPFLLRDPSGRSLEGRVVVLPNNPCLTAEGSGGNWVLSGHFAGYDAMDLMLDGVVITHPRVAVLSPQLAFPSDQIVLPMDGSPVDIGPFFYRNDGTKIEYSEFDPELFASSLAFTLTRNCQGNYAGRRWTSSSTQGNVAVELEDSGIGYQTYTCRLVRLSNRGLTIGENYDFSGGNVPIERLTATVNFSNTGAGSDTAELCVCDPFGSSRSLGSAGTNAGSASDQTVTFNSSAPFIVDGSSPANAYGTAAQDPEHYSILFPSRYAVSVTMLYGTYGSAAQPPRSFLFTPAMTNGVSGESYESLYTYSATFNVTSN